jgi:hypothetical protein
MTLSLRPRASIQIIPIGLHNKLFAGSIAEMCGLCSVSRSSARLRPASVKCRSAFGFASARLFSASFSREQQILAGDNDRDPMLTNESEGDLQ